MHNCITLERAHEVLGLGLRYGKGPEEPGAIVQIYNLMPSRACRGSLVYHFMKVCSAGSKASKSDKFSRATGMVHAAFLAEKMEEPLDVLLESQRLCIS